MEPRKGPAHGAAGDSLSKGGKEQNRDSHQALSDFAGSPASKAKLTTALLVAGLLDEGHGHAGTVQERIRIERQGTASNRIRVWCIDEGKLARLLDGRELRKREDGPTRKKA